MVTNSDSTRVGLCHITYPYAVPRASSSWCRIPSSCRRCLKDSSCFLWIAAASVGLRASASKLVNCCLSSWITYSSFLKKKERKRRTFWAQNHSPYLTASGKSARHGLCWWHGILQPLQIPLISSLNLCPATLCQLQLQFSHLLSLSLQLSILFWASPPLLFLLFFLNFFLQSLSLLFSLSL